MKRVLFALVVSLSLFSCSLENNYPNFNLEMIPIISVEMPTIYAVDSVTQIPVTYIRPTPCYQFSNFYYNAIGNERTVAVYCTNNSDQVCTSTDLTEVTVPLNFKPDHTGTYTFRFWIGVNNDGVDQYIEHEIVVDH